MSQISSNSPTAAPAENGAAGAHPFVLGIMGDSGSGKSTVSDAVRQLLGPDHVTDLKLDDYIRYTRAERAERGVTSLHPSVHDFEMMLAHMQLLRSGRSVRLRSYEHADGTFGSMRTITPRDVVLVRGLLGFPTTELRQAYDLAVFLAPHSDLLFRWKLRRDVRSRGYKEAEVLSYIAHHLLDSKEFVLPQTERADLVVQYDLPDPEAPDSEVHTTLVLRRSAADALQGSLTSLDRFGDGVSLEHQGRDVVLRLWPHLDQDAVDAWARERFPDTYNPALIGCFETDEGERVSRPYLAFLEVLIARLTQKMRRGEDGGQKWPAA